MVKKITPKVIKKSLKRIIGAIGAEVQLVVNKTKAKAKLASIGKKKTTYLEKNSYGGAENAVFSGVFDKYEWFYNQVNHNAPMDYKREARKPWWAFDCMEKR